MAVPGATPSQVTTLSAGRKARLESWELRQQVFGLDRDDRGIVLRCHLDAIGSSAQGPARPERSGRRGQTRTAIPGLEDRGPVRWTTRPWGAYRDSNPDSRFRKPVPFPDWTIGSCEQILAPGVLVALEHPVSGVDGEWPRLAQKYHPRYFRGPVGFPVVAGEAGRYQVLPGGSATTGSRSDVIQGQVPRWADLSAVLAPVAVSQK